MRFSALLLLLVAVGCSDAESTPTVAVRAVYLESLFNGQAARFDHEAVPGWMDAMTMPFAVADPSLLEGIEPGTPVEIAMDTVEARVVGLTPLPAGTALDLAGD